MNRFDLSKAVSFYLKEDIYIYIVCFRRTGGDAFEKEKKK
jgi:hypothetical protein